MAITNIHSIKTTLDKSIAYIINPSKTENGIYVNSYGCSADCQKATEEFLTIRNMGTGRGDILEPV